MKKLFLQSVILIVSSLLITPSLFSQSPQGIPYQAVMRNADGTIMANSAVSLTFMIHDGTANGNVVYQESHSLNSNTQGLVSCVVGNGVVSEGNSEASLSQINWGGGAKFLHVMMGSTDLGTQQMLSVPYALYAGACDIQVSLTGDTLHTGGGNFVIIPGISAANFSPTILGCTDNAACNYNSAATQNDNSCLYLNATCDDGNNNTFNDVINGSCQCAGTAIVSGCTNAQACNYNAAANVDNGSCLIQGAACNDNNANTTNDVINGSCVCAGTAVGNGTYVPGNGATDIDGNTYTSIIINGQEWMQQNLAVTKYRNGDPIPTGLSDATWSSTTSGAYANYNNDAANNTLYGQLYNWYAVNDSRGVCPAGWHVPSDAEWTTLTNNLGGSSVAGGKMKATMGWNSPNTGATNESGFTGFPGGYRDNAGTYGPIGYSGYWWSSSEFDSSNAWYRGLGYSISLVDRTNPNKRIGFSVRCVRDSESSPIQGCTDGAACNFMANANQDDGSCLYLNANCDDGNANTTNDVINGSCVCAGTAVGNGTYVPGNGTTDIDGNTYTSIIINGQEWMQQNLAVTKYRNGDPIPTGLSNTTWQNTTSGAYAIYNNDAANNTLYGKLYNWYAVNDGRGLCPTGWHVPSDTEWTTLETNLGGSSVPGGKMKATIGWNSPNTGATNESGFTGFPGGYRNYFGTYDYIGDFGFWWSSTENDSGNAWYRLLYYNYSDVDRDVYDKQGGFSVRCVRDSETSPIQGCTDGAACNFMANANQDDGSCLYLNATCDDGNANTINDVINGSCQCVGVLIVNGCTNAQACNYNASANVDNGSCLLQGTACNDNNANTTNDVINGSCVCAGTAVGNGTYVPGNGATDIDGNTYTSIIINGQEWMQQNLAVTKYRNGDPIPTGLSNTTWQNTTNGAYAIYNNDAANNTLYGKLYNWYAVNDSRGLCPTGWHVPSDAEWSSFINYLDPNANGGDSFPNLAGGKMKAITGWISPNTDATNESGFTGLPGGFRGYYGTYNVIGYYGYWWSSSELDSVDAWNRRLDYNNSVVLRLNDNKRYGFSVRCVRD